MKVHMLLNWEGLNGPVMAKDLVIPSNVQKLDVFIILKEVYKFSVRIVFALCFTFLNIFP